MKFRLALITFILAFTWNNKGNAQVCIPTYGTVCFTGGGGITYDVIDSFWTVGGLSDISNLDTDCCLLPNNYWFTGQAVTVCPGMVIETNVQCQPAAFDQGFAIWIDWNQNDIFEGAEKVYSSPTFGDEVFTGSFTVPGDVTSGETFNMRARSEYAVGGASIDPCDFQTYGETEDYLVVVGTCAPTICEGDTVELELEDLPPGPLTYSWSPATDISDPAGGPTVEVWPPDTTTYTCTITSPDGTWDVVHEVFVVFPPNPFAGLDDTICHDLLVPYNFDGATIETDEADVGITWDIAEFFGLGSPAAIWTPDDDVLNPGLQVSEPGVYDISFTTTDLSGYCPEQIDTVRITFSEARHTLEATDPLCFGSSDGTITVTGIGTLPSVEFSIDGGPWQTDNTFSDLPAGIYDITSRDAYGCEYTSSIELVDPDEVIITVSSDTLICQNGTATLEASATGGTDFFYDWSIDGADDGPIQTVNPVISPYVVTVSVTNENGCTSTEETIEVTLRDPITLVITENDSICPGFPSSHTVVATGGDGDYDYTWSAEGTPIFDTDNEIDVNPLEDTEYCVTVNDGCETTPETICVSTIMRPVPVPSFTSDVTAGCVPTTVNFEADLLAGDLAVWTIDGAIYNDFETVAHEFSEIGFYEINLHITNIYGCENEITASDYIEIVDIPYPDFYINPNPTTIFNTEVLLTPSVDGTGNTFFWETPGAIPANSTEESPRVIYPEGVPGDYEVTLTVTNEYGCSNTVDHTVNILTDVIIYAANIFTPDGDEFNEGWRIYIDGIDIYDYNLKIFNRWGEIVWESYDANATWYGTYGNQNAMDGTYVWVVQAKESTTDKRLEFRGTVTITR